MTYKLARQFCGFEISGKRQLLLLVALISLALGGCNRESAQIRALQAENEALRKALEATRKGTSDSGGEVPQSVEKVDLDLSITELWTQRFEDNQFRARQRLDHKIIRVTGTVESISDRVVTLFGTGSHLGSISLVAKLDDGFLKQIFDGLTSLQKGSQITVQGRFVFDKMWLEGAVFVDRKTGKCLSSKDLMNLEGANADATQSPAKVGSGLRD